MSKHKVKDLLSNLGDLPSFEAGKVSLQDLPFVLGKRSAVDPSHDLGLRKTKGKSSTKLADNSDPLSSWLEDTLPPLRPQPSRFLGHKSSPRSFLGSQSSLGKGVIDSLSVALQLGKSVLLPSIMGLHGIVQP